MLFDKLYLMAEFNPNNDGYGCVVTTMPNIAHKVQLLTFDEVRNGLDWLHDHNFIHRERSSKYKNSGYLIKINHYEKLNKLKVTGTTSQLPVTDQSTTSQLPVITGEYKKENDDVKISTTNQLPIDLNGTTSTINQRKEHKERKLKNSPKGEGVDADATPPKKTRKESKPKIPSKTNAAYLAYKDAIKERHGIELSPQGGADVRSILSKLIDEYGEEKAVTIVKAYVNIKDNFLEQNLHHIKFIGSKINVVLKEAENVKATEDVPMKWCQYREQMVPMKKILINGETRWI